MLTNLVDLIRGNRVLLWVCAVIAINQLGFGISVPVLPLYADSFGVSQVAIGLTVAIYGLGRMLFNMPMGQLTDRIGRRQVVLWGELITAAGSLLCGLAPTFEWLLVFRFLGGIGAATVITGTQVMVTDIATPANRGRVMSVYMGWFLFAVGLGPTPGGFIATWFGLQAPFFAFAALSLVAALVCWRWLPETRPVAGRWPAGEAGSPAANRPPERPPATSAVLRQLLSTPAFPLVSLVTLTHFMARTGAIFAVVPVLVHDRLGLTTAQIGLALTLGNAVNLMLMPFAGILTDRLGRRPLIVPGALLSGVAFAAFAVVDSYPLFIALCLLWGFAVGVGGSAPGAYVADLAPPGANGATMGIYRTLSDVGYVVGPALLGIVADAAGAGAALLTIGAIFLVAGTLFGLFAPETHRRPAPAATSASADD
jgi:multidrug resistance protein